MTDFVVAGFAGWGNFTVLEPHRRHLDFQHKCIFHISCPLLNSLLMHLRSLCYKIEVQIDKVKKFLVKTLFPPPHAQFHVFDLHAVCWFFVKMNYYNLIHVQNI